MQGALTCITHDRLRPSQPPHPRRCWETPSAHSDRSPQPSHELLCLAFRTILHLPIQSKSVPQPIRKGCTEGSKTNPFPTVMGLNKPKNLKNLIGTMALNQRRCVWSRGIGVAGCRLRGKYSAFQRVMLTADHSGNSTKGSGRPQTQQRQYKTRAAVRPHSLG